MLLLSVLVAAAEADYNEKKELTKRLTPLLKKKQWSLYADILAGDNINEKTMEQVSKSDLVLLILSADFLADDTCHKIAGVALERHQANKNTTVAVLLRHCDWQNTYFNECHILPFDHETIAESQNGADCWYQKIIKGIEPLMKNAELIVENNNLRQENYILQQYIDRLMPNIKNGKQ